ncbi:Tify domain-containing protein [Heracleum sosnowskyi]|uniref:Protein TIFY n=1 Tax=Heracleum sosnowskyi TaxID=360622 RepID=A0AAD8MCW2_9APIA|nr:Tify domain-containing protein [Heracleum sosnowskyi]
MERNCNLELRLVTPSFDDHSVAENAYHNQLMKEEIRSQNPQEKQLGNQKLTIFYNGRVSSCDVTEIQARSIISLANQEIVGEKTKTPTCSDESMVWFPKPQYKQNTSLSMKKSLQQFLQKRRSRIQETSPY